MSRYIYPTYPKVCCCCCCIHRWVCFGSPSPAISFGRKEKHISLGREQQPPRRVVDAHGRLEMLASIQRDWARNPKAVWAGIDITNSHLPVSLPREREENTSSSIGKRAAKKLFQQQWKEKKERRMPSKSRRNQKEKEEEEEQVEKYKTSTLIPDWPGPSKRRDRTTLLTTFLFGSLDGQTHIHLLPNQPRPPSSYPPV
jgi:hypothetical protein